MTQENPTNNPTKLTNQIEVLEEIRNRLIQLRSFPRDTKLKPFDSLEELYDQYLPLIKGIQGSDPESVFSGISEIRDWFNQALPAIKQMKDVQKELEDLHLQAESFKESNLDYSELLSWKTKYDEVESRYNKSLSDSEGVVDGFNKFREIAYGLSTMFAEEEIARQHLRSCKRRSVLLSASSFILRLVGAILTEAIISYLYELFGGKSLPSIYSVIIAVVAFSAETWLSDPLTSKVEENIVWKLYDRLLNQLDHQLVATLKHLEKLQNILSVQNNKGLKT